MKKNAGFTLIELMIVVAIIAIIAAIAIPSLLRSRLQANESSCIGNLRAVVAAEVAYFAANNAYTGTWTDLTTATPAYLQGTWADAQVKSGYTIALTLPDPSCFALAATPAQQDKTGSRGFYADCSGVIRAAAGGTATAASTPIGD